MLALPRPSRVAHILRLHARALSTVAQSAGSPNIDLEQLSNDPAADKPAQTKQTRVTNSSAECMFVLPWNGIRSSAEGLAIARALQDKYGPAKEVLFPRVRRATRTARIAPSPPSFTPLTAPLTRRTPIASISSSRTFGSCMMTQTCASAFQRGRSRSRYRSLSPTCLRATAISVSKK